MLIQKCWCKILQRCYRNIYKKTLCQPCYCQTNCVESQQPYPALLCRGHFAWVKVKSLLAAPLSSNICENKGFVGWGQKNPVFSALGSISDLDSSKARAMATLFKTFNLNPSKYRKQMCVEHLSVAAAHNSLQSEVEVVCIIWALESPKVPPDHESAVEEPSDFLRTTPIFASRERMTQVISSISFKQSLLLKTKTNSQVLSRPDATTLTHPVTGKQHSTCVQFA